MGNKKVFTNSRDFPSLPSMTLQESQIYHFLSVNSISFECQKVFQNNNRRFIVDFFIDDKIILECTSTSIKKFQVAFRQKAIQLEEKCSQLSDVFAFPIWVLFEAPRFISPQFLQTLTLLLPSVQKIFTSRQELIEILLTLNAATQVFPSLNQVDSENLLGGNL